MRRCDPDAMFTAGLLHDIGELVIFNRLPTQSHEILQRVLESQDEVPVHVAEMEVLGFDHSTVGGELAHQWGLPPLLQACIAHHHDIAAAKVHQREVALIHIANVVALMAEVDTLDPDDVEPIDPRAWEVTGLDRDVMEPAMRAAQAEVQEIEKLFLEQK
jgi:HD-like signal output (HDOD) protein